MLIAVAALAVTAVTVLAAAATIRSLVRQQARERQLLLDRIMHLAGHTWTPPPAETWTAPSVPEESGRYVTVPEQLPDDEDWDR